MGYVFLMLGYLLASVSFIVGLKMLSHPDTAKRGNRLAAAGMTIAIVVTIFLYEDNGERLGNYGWIFGALFIGAVIGWIAARKVQMTAMPEMVSLFNGMGGACAALISMIEFNHLVHETFLPHLPLSEETLSGTIGQVPMTQVLVIMLGLVIGTVSFAGSMIAWGKLNGRVNDFSFRGLQLVNILLLSVILAFSTYLIVRFSTDSAAPGIFENAQTAANSFTLLFYLILVLAILYGVFFVLPIGGADMPVVISLLNSFTGVAAACGGFLYNNKAMLTGGILVGAAGTLLTILMCRAMNRSLKNVLLGSFGASAKSGSRSSEQGSFKEITLSDAGMMMAYAERVMIVPGYGLAVAQAQHICHELEKLLTQRGVEVAYAIHPVAGRMPGHMNVLLAEADVSYEKLLELEEANQLLPRTDVVLVLGANDVVNPAAKTDPASPIYGMPILDVEQARQVIVNKRSMKPGYAGIENPLFFGTKTSMLFGDAKKVLQELVATIKEI